MKNLGLTLLIICFGCINNVSSQNILKNFSDFEEAEKDREIFLQELIELDKLLQFDDYLSRLKEFKPTELTIKVTKDIISLDFAQVYCKDYGELKNDQKIPNIEKLRQNQKLRIYCRDIASSLDVFPKRTGDLSNDCKNYLEAIEILVSENQEVLGGLTFKGYQKLEESKKITTDSERFLFRKKFLKFLNEKYHVSID